MEGFFLNLAHTLACETFFLADLLESLFLYAAAYAEELTDDPLLAFAERSQCAVDLLGQ